MVRLKNVSVSYDNRIRAVDNVNLSFEQGEFAFLIGSTGAGKSTLLKLITREALPTSGEVWINGKNTASLRGNQVAMLRREMGIVPQDFGLLPNKRVWENVEYALRVIGISKKDARKRILDVLDRVGLSRRADAFPHQLSGGEAQRVAIARAIANNPVLLIADEPTGNLDPDTSIEIMEILDHINSRGTTIIVATHDVLSVDRMRKRVVEINRGAVLRDEIDSAYACIT